MPCGVIAFDAGGEPEDIGDAQEVAEFLLNLLLVHVWIAVGAEEATFRRY